MGLHISSSRSYIGRSDGLVLIGVALAGIHQVIGHAAVVLGVQLIVQVRLLHKLDLRAAAPQVPVVGGTGHAVELASGADIDGPLRAARLLGQIALHARLRVHRVPGKVRAVIEGLVLHHGIAAVRAVAGDGQGLPEGIGRLPLVDLQIEGQAIQLGVLDLHRLAVGHKVHRLALTQQGGLFLGTGSRVGGDGNIPLLQGLAPVAHVQGVGKAAELVHGHQGIAVLHAWPVFQGVRDPVASRALAAYFS